MTEEQLDLFQKTVRKERIADWGLRGLILVSAIVWLLHWVFPQAGWMIAPVMILLMALAFGPELSPFLRRRPVDTYRQIIEQQINANPDMIRRLAADRVADHSTPAKEI